MAFSTKILTAFLLLIFLSPALTLANGGDQRVVEGKYLVNLSRSSQKLVARSLSC